LKRLLYPADCHDISPSDFYPFGKIKTVLIGREIPDEINFLDALTKILNGTSNAELQHVFQNWIKRVERVIDAGGNYLT
jgi:hypothetical protein